MRIEARDAVIERSGRVALSALSTALEPGTITALCGPNGAGKSSLLMGMAGILPLRAGEIRLGARALGQWPLRERARAIGYLPQHAEVAWDVSVESLVRLARLPHGDGDRAEGMAAVEGALRALGLESCRHRIANRLSGGERARALLARVVAGEPRWILADEPLAALDLGHQLALLAHLRQLAREGIGIVLVVHDLALAMNHADRVLVLDRARLVADGPPSQALAEPVLSRVWRVNARWVAEQGRLALALPPA